MSGKSNINQDDTKPVVGRSSATLVSVESPEAAAARRFRHDGGPGT